MRKPVMLDRILGFAPRYDLDRAFSDYLVPTIRRRYAADRRPE